jgi:hypothetical protein
MDTSPTGVNVYPGVAAARKGEPVPFKEMNYEQRWKPKQ